MKLFYDRKSKDPVYYAQLGIRNGKKTTTRNVARIGKHSELLKLTDDPLAYAKEQIKKMNEEYEEKKKAGLEPRIDFTKRISASENPVSEKTTKNIGYFYLNKHNDGFLCDCPRESILLMTSLLYRVYNAIGKHVF